MLDIALLFFDLDIVRKLCNMGSPCQAGHIQPYWKHLMSRMLIIQTGFAALHNTV